MALVSLSGMSHLVYPFDRRILRPTVIEQLTLSSSDSKVALGGRVWFQERTLTKDIVRVGILLGTVVKSGGSSLLLSLQNMDLFNSADQPRPDGNIDQSVVIANSNAGFVSNSWLRSGTLSGARTVNFGEHLCVVVSFNSYGGSDSVGIGVRKSDTFAPMRTPWASLFTSSWVKSPHWPIIVLEFDDGTFGTLTGAYVTAGPGEHIFGSTSSPDEYGLQFVVPFSCKADALLMACSFASTTTDLDLVLYEGTTELAVRNIGAEAGPESTMLMDGGGTPVGFSPHLVTATLASEVTIAGGTTVILAARQNNDSQCRLFYEELGDAGHQALWAEGQPNVGQVSRTNAGAWSSVDGVKLPLFGIRVSALSDTGV